VTDEKKPSLEDAQELLRLKSLELLDAPVGRLPALNIQVQRLRVLVILLREVETGVSDSNTYREMALLSKLATGTDFESEASKEQQVEEEAKATERLMARGIQPEAAQRISRVLQSVIGAKEMGFTPKVITGPSPASFKLDDDDDELDDDPGKDD